MKTLDRPAPQDEQPTFSEDHTADEVRTLRPSPRSDKSPKANTAQAEQAIARKPFPSAMKKKVETAVAKVDQPNTRRVLSQSGKNVSFGMLLLTLLSYLAWFRNERLAVGYCDTGSSTNALIQSRQAASAPNSIAVVHKDVVPTDGSLDLGSLVEAFRPSCMACPAHGNCVSGQLVKCDADYLQRPNPITTLTGNLVPMPAHCSPDTEKLVRVAEIASVVDRKLRVQKGQVICNGPRLPKKGAVKEEKFYGRKLEDLQAELMVHRNVSSAFQCICLYNRLMQYSYATASTFGRAMGRIL